MPDDAPDPLKLHDVRPEHVKTHELLARVLAELAEVRAEVRALRSVADNGSQICAPGPEVVPLIATCVGACAFSAAELVDHCRLPQASTLRTASTFKSWEIMALGGCSCSYCFGW